METSVFPEIVAFTGIPLRQTINSGDQLLYKQALAAPADYAAVVLAFDGDEIDRAVHQHPQGLRMVRRFTSAHQPAGTLYVSDTFPTHVSDPASAGKPAR